MDYEQLGASHATYEAIAGLPAGYLSKLIGPHAPRRIGMISLGPLLGAIGCELVIVENPERMAEIAGRLTPRREYCVRHRRSNGAAAA